MERLPIRFRKYEGTATTGFIEPCLPSQAETPPVGADWLHEIKHATASASWRGGTSGA
jgi:hypothetical protein